MILNWKLTSAFTTGALLASGIVYYAVRPPETRHPQVSHVVAPKPSVPPPAVAKAIPLIPAPVQVPRQAAAPVPVPPRAVVARASSPVQHLVVREKPSPMPPPVRHNKPAEVAKLEPVEPAPVAPSPAEHDQTPAVAPAPGTSLPHPAPAPAIPAPAPAPAPVIPPSASAPVTSAPARITPPPAASSARITPPPAAASARITPAPSVPPSPRENVPLRNVLLPAPNSEARVPHTVTLAGGTLLQVRIGETLSSSRNQPGDTFLATLTQPLVIDGWIIAERGARVEGRVLDASQGGRVSGAAHLGISIVRFATADGQNIRIHTEPLMRAAGAFTGTDAAKIGAGAAIGAVIGGIAGGGRGAAIGAGAGGAIGAGDVLLTRGQSAEIRVESRINFKVQDSVTITERLD